MKDVELALKQWREAGPLSQESLKLLLDWREANLMEQSADLVFAAFVRSLSREQQAALAEVLAVVDEGEAFRLF